MEYADKLHDEVKLLYKPNETELQIHHVEANKCLARVIFDLRDYLDVDKEFTINLQQEKTESLVKLNLGMLSLTREAHEIQIKKRMPKPEPTAEPKITKPVNDPVAFDRKSNRLDTAL
jgi:hypothetical protein